MLVLWILLAALVCFLAAILIRALRFQPYKVEPTAAEAVALNEEKIVRDMQDMIRCKTVSSRDEAEIDRAEFAKFGALMAERFPNIYAACAFYKIGKTGLMYHLKGESAEKPSVCMAHYDVVPVEQENWSRPAFDGALIDGHIWGRGTMDTKGTLCGVCEALEQLLAGGYTPKNDLYLAFSGEEEVDGDSCREMVAWLDARGVKPEFVLDEGGAIVGNVFPGVSRECAMIGIGEKGGLNLEFTRRSAGGHASTPPPRSALGDLSRAVAAIEAKPFRRQLTPPVAQMFDILGRESTFLYRLIFANLWCFMPVLDMICKKSGGELNAILRTTVAVTRMQGSKAFNVLPQKATLGLNLRLLGNDTIASATEYLQQVIGNDAIDVAVVSGMEASPFSSTDCEGWGLLTQTIRESWPEILVSPYLMMACSDSRHYCEISDKVYRFSGMRMSKEERAMIHGSDERIPVETLLKTVEFYIRLLKKL